MWSRLDHLVNKNSSIRVKQSAVVSLAGATLLVAACGGGGGSSGDTTATLSADPGFYLSDVSVSGDTRATEALTLMSADGTYVTVLNGEPFDATFGKLDISGAAVTGTAVNIFLLSGDLWGKTRGTVSGEVTGTGTLALQATAEDGGSSSTVTLQRQSDLSNQGLSLATLTGTYTGTIASGGTESLQFTIAADGAVVGSHAKCNFTGQATVPNGRFNVFELAIDASSCPGRQNGAESILYGNFTGLGAYDYAGASVVFIINNTEIGIYGEIPKR